MRYPVHRSDKIKLKRTHNFINSLCASLASLALKMENVIDYMNVALLSYKTRIFTIRPGYMIRGDRIYARSSLQSAVLNSEKKKKCF